jgi:hypothetical protein
MSALESLPGLLAAVSDGWRAAGQSARAAAYAPERAPALIAEVLRHGHALLRLLRGEALMLERCLALANEARFLAGLERQSPARALRGAMIAAETLAYTQQRALAPQRDGIDWHALSALYLIELTRVLHGAGPGYEATLIEPGRGRANMAA